MENRVGSKDSSKATVIPLKSNLAGYKHFGLALGAAGIRNFIPAYETAPAVNGFVDGCWPEIDNFSAGNKPGPK